MGLDYDEVVEDLPMAVNEADAAEAQEESGGCCGSAAAKQESVAAPENPATEEDEVMKVAARYIAGKLKKELETGTGMGLNDLYMLLRFCDVMKD